MILIVDDKPENIFSLKSILQLHSFPVDTALSGEEALKKALKNSYALIILDVQMPAMDGFEVAGYLSENSSTRDIPIIFLSAVNTEKKFITKGYTSGAIDYIVKPIDPDILILKVKTFFRLYEQNRELLAAHQLLQDEIEVRKKTELLIQEKAKELEGILTSIPQIAFTAAPDGTIEYVNQQWFNYSTSITEFPAVHPDDKCLIAEWKRTLLSGDILELELRIKKLREEEYKFHLLRAVPVKEKNKIVKWVGTFANIEEQKLAVKRRDDFVGMVSHELKTPLTSISGYMEIIDSTVQEEEMKFFTSRILKQVGRLHNLINELLDISKMKNGKLDFVMEEVNVQQVFTDTIEMLRDIYPKNNIQCIFNAPVTVKGNAQRLEQVLINLISNAVKYSVLDKNIAITTSITADNKLYCGVKDWGIGISEDKQKAVFDKFYRVGDPMTFAQGLGVGLYISAEILKVHGADFGVTSKPGNGSLFYFTIPVLNRFELPQ
jgi:signal transduction histidine kinase